ncbi:hypothetical protein Tco_1136533 [Tanacetum coccineum]
MLENGIDVVDCLTPSTVSSKSKLRKDIELSHEEISSITRLNIDEYTEVTAYFQKEMRETKRSYDSFNCKWKNRIRLKDHQKWKYVEITKLDLNDEATDSEDVEVQEVQPIGQDRAKKKGSSSASLELEMEDLRRREQAELERLILAEANKFEEHKLAQKNKELELQENVCISTRRKI